LRNSKNELAVQVAGLSRRFGQFVAVDHVSFSVRQGEIFGFLGANGAGKTTTIRMLCGLLTPSGGSGTVAGYDIIREYEKIKLRIGYMSQKFSLYNDLTVTENIGFYGGIYGLSPRRVEERTKELFGIIGLEELQYRLTSSLPIGWKQRLALCASLLHDPRIVFLDEPTSGVDPISRRSFWKLIYTLSDMGKTVFVTTHYMDEAEYCHRLSIMKRGKIVEMDDPQNLKDKYKAQTMEEVFLSSVQREDA
jgi:ABC-2 type transport system ATP-binding protein